jgi:hypothetical protein
MTTENTTPTTNATESAANGKPQGQPRPREVYATAAEAQAADPHHKQLRLYRVACPGGEVKFTWAGSSWDAVLNAARAAGYRAASAGKAPTKDSVAQQLAQLSAEDRAALLASYAPAGKRK